MMLTDIVLALVVLSFAGFLGWCIGWLQGHNHGYAQARDLVERGSEELLLEALEARWDRFQPEVIDVEAIIVSSIPRK